jgi:hypothetical protein
MPNQNYTSCIPPIPPHNTPGTAPQNNSKKKSRPSVCILVLQSLASTPMVVLTAADVNEKKRKNSVQRQQKCDKKNHSLHPQG